MFYLLKFAFSALSLLVGHEMFSVLFPSEFDYKTVGMVELCAKNLQIMRNDFTDYARTFCQLCANYARA